MVKAQAQELDFLGLEKQASDRRRRFKGIQNAITKMNPEVIKSVIASASSSTALHLRPIAVPSSCSRAISTERMTTEETAPMTIFYNGMVTVFDAPKVQAESILRMAMAKSLANVELANKAAAGASSLDQEGLPISRKKSLERFFEKRKERLLWVSPYEVSKGSSDAAAAKRA